MFAEIEVCLRILLSLHFLGGEWTARQRRFDALVH